MSAGSTRSKWSSETGPEALFGGKDAALFGRRQKRPRGARLPVIVVVFNDAALSLIKIKQRPAGQGGAEATGYGRGIGKMRTWLESRQEC